MEVEPVKRLETLVCILSLLVVTASSQVHAGTWRTRSVSAIEATSPPPAEADAALAPVPGPDPTLQRLSDIPPPASRAEPAWQSPHRRLTQVEGDLGVPAEEVEVLLEQNRVRSAIERSRTMMRARQPEQALAELERVAEGLQTDESRRWIHQELGTIYFRMQRFLEAEHHMATAHALAPDNPSLASNLAAVQLTIGELDEAADTLTGIDLALVRNPAILFSIHFNFACLHSLQGDADRALEHLEQAAAHDAGATYTSIGDPQLDPLRDDARFRDFAAALELTLR